MATHSKHNFIILGSNDTAYQLQQGILAKDIPVNISIVNDSDYIYCPSTEYPKLLAGNLSIKEAGLLSNFFHSSQVNYLRTAPKDTNNSILVNTIPDAHCISVLHLPHGRRRYFTLHNTDNVIMAGAELAQYSNLIVYGSSQKAISYATEAAKAGYKTWFVAPKNTLVNKSFDQNTKQLISDLLNQAGVTQISVKEAKKLEATAPCLYTPYSEKNHGLMRIYQQLNNHYKDYPTADYQLVHGGDWYQLPLQASEQLIARVLDIPDNEPSKVSYMWSNKPSLPHKFNINETSIHYAGQLESEQTGDCLTMSVPECGIYRKIILEEDRVVGFLFAGDVRGSEHIVDMMLTHRSISNSRNDLLFIGR